MKEQSAAPQTGATVKGYRTLTNDETAMMNELKKTSQAFQAQLEVVRDYVRKQYRDANALHDSGAEVERLDDAEPQRWISIARTHIQEGCMAACRAVAQPSGKS